MYGNIFMLRHFTEKVLPDPFLINFQDGLILFCQQPVIPQNAFLFLRRRQLAPTAHQTDFPVFIFHAGKAPVRAGHLKT